MGSVSKSKWYWLLVIVTRLADGLSRGKNFLILTALGYVMLFFFDLWDGSIRHPRLIPFWNLSITPMDPPLDRRALIDLLYSRFLSPRMNVLQGLILAFIFVVYLVTLVNWQKIRFKVSDTFRMGLITGSLGLFILPCNSWDVYSYIEFGRLTAIHGLNPYLHGYASVWDSYSPWAWRGAPMPYGPGGLPVYMVAGILSELNVFVGVYFLKLVGLFSYLLSSWVLYKVLRLRTADPGFPLFLFMLNPLLSLELIVNGHNDGLMILFMLVAIWLLTMERDGTALVCAFMAALVKHPGIFLFAGIVVYLIRQGRWNSVVRGLLATALISLVVWLVLFPEIKAIEALANSNQPINTNTLQGFLLHSTTIDSKAFYLSGTMIGFRVILTIFFGVFCLWRLTQIKNFDTLAAETAYITLAFMLGYLAAMHAWYVLWLLPIAAITASERFRNIVVGWSFTVLALYIFPSGLADKSVIAGAVRLVMAHGILVGLFFPAEAKDSLQIV